MHFADYRSYRGFGDDDGSNDSPASGSAGDLLGNLTLTPPAGVDVENSANLGSNSAESYLGTTQLTSASGVTSAGAETTLSNPESTGLLSDVGDIFDPGASSATSGGAYAPGNTSGSVSSSLANTAGILKNLLSPQPVAGVPAASPLPIILLALIGAGVGIYFLTKKEN